ncbi:hypothetical protein HanIR_Chr02g0067221 [Helianthus annuus]|nr:hypothetical protein HanIR_Chr02g0067221 [Helianthus annuus]
MFGFFSFYLCFAIYPRYIGEKDGKSDSLNPVAKTGRKPVAVAPNWDACKLLDCHKAVATIATEYAVNTVAKTCYTNTID